MAARQDGAQTVLTGLLDQSALHGVLADIEALGLDLVEVRQPGRRRKWSEHVRCCGFGGVVGPLRDRPMAGAPRGLGAMQLAGDGVFGPPRDRAEAVAVLQQAVADGVDHIDTAQFYGPAWSTS